jgi:CHAT domain-containing protein
VDQAQLLRTIKQFRREVTNPLRTHTSSYLSSSQQLYRWLIAPIQPSLKAQRITNLVFLPEAGLRALPYAALHNGQQFLIEQFSIGLMPSVGLTQTTFQDLRSAKALAIGVSESTQGQSPLPMVKTELAIVSQLWRRNTTYVNDQATLATLRTARSRYPFQIVHLATHATFTAGVPQNAHIQLWNDRLKLSQIRQLDWSDPPIELLGCFISWCRPSLKVTCQYQKFWASQSDTWQCNVFFLESLYYCV